MLYVKRKWKRLLPFAVILMATLAASAAFAAPPKSDDFKNGLGAFWKVKQVTGAATLGAPSNTAKGGRLNLTSADNDVYQGTWEPYFVYQDGLCP